MLFRQDCEADVLSELLQDSREPPVKKLAIREEPSEEEKYDFVTQVRTYVGGEADRTQAQYVAVDEADEKVRSNELPLPPTGRQG